MPLLADYAITPDVFDVTSYSTPGECEARLDTVREAMLTEGLVRNLRDGDWGALFNSDDRPWHPRGTELVKKLEKQGRLVRHDSELSSPPIYERDWCAEAIATHAAEPLTGGIIVTKSVKDQHRKEPAVARIDRLAGAAWWRARSPSVLLQRTRADYETQLDLVLRQSNSLIFIDPHLDPAKPGYRAFGRLLTHAGGRAPAPRIEIHRVCYEGSGRQRRLPMRDEPAYFERRFHGPDRMSCKRPSGSHDDMQSERAVSSRPEYFHAGTIIDALDVTMPDEHGRITSVRICCWRRRDWDRHDFHARY